MVGHGDDIFDGGADEAFDIDTDVVTESGVFTCEEGVNEMGWELFILDEATGVIADGCEF